MPKIFSFRLETVLKLREHKTKQAMEELTEVVGLRYNKEKEIEEQVAYRDELLKSQTQNGIVGDFQAKWHHKLFIEENIEKLEIEKLSLLEIEEVKRKNLNEAMKDEKILGKLKEKQKIVYDNEINKEIQAFLDEIAINFNEINRSMKI